MTDEIDPGKAARRVMRHFAGVGGGGAHESGGAGGGLPGNSDVAAIAKRLRDAASAASSRQETVLAPEAAQSADGLARQLVAEANRAILSLRNGASPHSLSTTQMLATEAVINARTRPAVRLENGDLEDMSDVPGAAIWRVVADTHRGAILTSCRATAAVEVTDPLAANMSWVQGSAWLIGPDRAITNRHVLFPPLGGTRLARRIPGGTDARLRKDLSVMLDFAHHSDAGAPLPYRVTDILFVAADGDPVDAAVLKVEPVGIAAGVLRITDQPQDDLERLYVIGHPGRMDDIPPDIRTVFGDTDERKRVSFGEIMDPSDTPTDDIVHDASTIGGFSGGCVMPFLSADAVGLHYWGDVSNGNRAITAAALRQHPELSKFL